MGQLRKVCDAHGEYVEHCVCAYLEEHGIPSVPLRHEIPMRPGFTFEGRPWSELYVREEDLARAVELASEVFTVIEGEETSSKTHWPPVISVRSLRWVAGVWVASQLLFAISLILIPYEATVFYGYDERWITPFILLVILVPGTVFYVALISYNQRLIGRACGAAFKYIWAVPLVPFALCYLLGCSLWSLARRSWQGFLWLIGQDK